MTFKYLKKKKKLFLETLTQTCNHLDITSLWNAYYVRDDCPSLDEKREARAMGTWKFQFLNEKIKSSSEEEKLSCDLLWIK